MKYCFFFLSLLFSITAFSQGKSEVLLTVGGKPVYVSEFKRVYEKNLDLVQDDSQRDVDEYLKLFIDYKLKVAEAYAQGLNNDPDYIREFSTYQDQISRNYVLNNKIAENMTTEAYNRSLEEVNAAHILILVDYDDKPSDTLAAYNKIKEVRKKALAGEDFQKLVREYSEEPNAKQNGSDLGYFSVFSMVYPFENAAYNTKIGEVSDIVRTQFGYHIIKIIDKRQRLPHLSVSHIMVSERKEQNDFDSKKRIDQVYGILQKNEQTFEALAQQYSDDRASAKNGGILNRFVKGDLRSEEFEKAAYNLKKPGQVSQPILSEFGWHIIRLDTIHPNPTLESQKEKLVKQIEMSDRSKEIVTTVNNLLKKKYNYVTVNDYLPYFTNFVNDDIRTRRWEYIAVPKKDDKVIFTIGKENYSFSDFAKFLKDEQKSIRAPKEKTALLKDLFYGFETLSLKAYSMEALEKENLDYAAVIGEYRDGLLIFDVMSRNVWEKARKDTTALKAYYESHKKDYVWQERADVAIFSANEMTIAESIQKNLLNGTSVKDTNEAFTKEYENSVIFTEGTFEKGDRELPSDYEWTEGVSKIIKKRDTYIVIYTSQLLPSSTKTYEDVKGKVISEYQEYLEEQWVESLHKKYKVELEKQTFKKVKKQLQP